MDARKQRSLSGHYLRFMLGKKLEILKIFYERQWTWSLRIVECSTK